MSALLLETNGAAPKAGGMLNLEQLATLGAARKTIKVVVNDRGDYVFVTELDGRDRDWVESQMPRAGEARRSEGILAKMIACGLTDEHGKKLLARNQWQQVAPWGSKLQQRLFDSICDVSGISEKARADFLALSDLTDSED